MSQSSFDFGFELNEKLGITTISATGYVEPEIVKGKETGRLTTTGTFIKRETVFDLTITDADGNATIETYSSRIEALKNVGFKGFFSDMKITKRTKETDLGNTINPADL